MPIIEDSQVKFHEIIGADLAYDASLTINIPAGVANHGIIVMAYALMATQTGQDYVTCRRYIQLNADVYGQLWSGTAAYGSGDNNYNGNTVSVSFILKAGVDYNPSQQNSVIFGPRIENSGVTADSGHFLSVYAW